MIYAAANGGQPYYTKNGGATWLPISLPGVSNWTGFLGAYFYTHMREVAADTVAANSFYILFPGTGVFKTTNGGDTWTSVSSARGFTLALNPQLKTTPGRAGDLWIASGSLIGNPGTSPFSGAGLYHSMNGGLTWTTITNVKQPHTIGFGAAAPGQSYPSVFIVGWVSVRGTWTYGAWESDDAGFGATPTWKQIGPYPNDSLDRATDIAGDPGLYGQVYVGFAGSGAALLRPPRQTKP